MRGKKRNKKRIFLSDTEKREFAQELKDGKMIKQLIAKYNISLPYGYQIFRELLEYKMEWKHEHSKSSGELLDA